MFGRRGIHALVALALAAGVIVGPQAHGLPTVARAEERGAVINLAYVHGYSNWGPDNVFGTARLWLSEGVATLSLHNLPRLSAGDQYASWIVNTTSGEALALGVFNANDAGSAEQDVIFSQAPPSGANAVLVTVMHPGDPSTLPGPQRTLAGYFPSTGHTRTTTPAQHTTAPAHAASTRPPARTLPRIQVPPSSGAHPVRPPARRGRAHPPAGTVTRGSGHKSHPKVVVLPKTGQAHAVHPAPRRRVLLLPHTGGGPAARKLWCARHPHQRQWCSHG